MNNLVSMTNSSHPIPGRLNMLLVAAVASIMIGALIFLCTSTAYGAGFFIASISYGIAFLCNYSLLHEACHDKLHPRPWLNRFLGTVSAMLFPISFSLIHKTHIGHHARNRTDHEMFDLYYEGDNVLAKRLHWYGLLLGIHYVLMVLSSFALLVLPSKTLAGILRRNSTYGPFVDALLTRKTVASIRVEAVAILVLLALMVAFLDMGRLLPALCFGIFLWSTNQYLTHVFSNRDRVEGGFNLTGAGILSWILLHREHDLTHHRQPDLPWNYLRSYRKDTDIRVNYYRHWLRQWTAPRLTQKHPGPPPEDGSQSDRPR